MPGSEIRVLQLLVSTSLGGGPRQVFETLRRLPRTAFRWTFAAPDDGPYFARFAELGPVYRMPLDGLSPATTLAVARLVRAERIDVVHSHGKGAGVHGRLAAAVSRAVAIHTFHGIHDDKYGRAGGAAYRALERALARLSYRVVNVSESQARIGERLRLWPRGRAVVIRNGIDADATRALARDRPLSRTAFGVPAGEPLLACVARLDPVKGVDVLIDAVARVQRDGRAVHALIAGAGPEERRLRERAAATTRGHRVVLAGEVPDAPRLLGDVDVYVSASRGEGLPLAVLEAMACGLPIVASGLPVHEEILGGGRAGLLAAVGDPADLAEKIARVLDDATLRTRLGEAARKDVERYDVRATAAALGTLYEDAVARRRGGPAGGDPAV